MKKLFVLVSFLLLGMNLKAQEKIKPDFTRKIEIHSMKGGRTIANAAFHYKDDLCVLSSEVNMQLQLGVFGSEYSSYNCGMTLYRTSMIKKGKTKTEIISLPVDKYFYTFLNSWYKGNTLNIYYSCSNTKNRSLIVFCTQYDLDTKKSKHYKVFETSLKNTLLMQITEEGTYSLLAAFDGKSHEKAMFDYLVADHDLKPIDGGLQVSLSEQDPLEIQSFTLSGQGVLVAQCMTKLPKKNILSKRTYGHPFFIVKNEKAKEIAFETDANYITQPAVFFNKKGQLMACYLYGEGNSTEGVALSEVDVIKGTMKRTTVYGLKGSSSKGIFKKKMEKLITSVQTTDDGNTMILSEDYVSYTRTVTTTSRQGMSTRSTTYYDYGPGTIYTFNSDFENTSACQFNYSVHYSNVDIGYGMKFLALPNNDVYVFSDNNFYKYHLNNTNYNGKAASSKAMAFKNLFGKYGMFTLLDHTAYIFDIQNKKYINVQEYKLP